MILTICCNPCIDSYLYVDHLTPHELNRISDTYSCIGGKGINVAKAITTLNHKAFVSGFMGDENKDFFQKELASLGVQSEFTLIKGRTRTNYKVNDSDGSITELNEKGFLVQQGKSEEFISLLKRLQKDADFVVFSGSLPKGIEEDYYEKLANNIILPFAIDAEKGKLLPCLHLNPEIIKPNVHELSEICSTQISTIDEILKASKTLIEKGAKRVLTSMGGDGAVLVTQTEAYYAKAPTVKVNSTVGAGDTMLSAAVIEIAKNSSSPTILTSAIAGGTAAVMAKGTDALNIDDYNKLLDQVEVNKIY